MKLTGVLTIPLLIRQCLAQGTGLIGYSRTMYYPLCAAACRGAIGSAALSCSPHEHSNDSGGHHGGPTPPECYATDLVFMQTLAYCIDTKCPKDIQADVLERYWTLHEVNGARVKLDPKPSMSYGAALYSIEEPPTKVYVSGEMLNETALVSDEDHESQCNGLGYFEISEVAHNRYRQVELRPRPEGK